MGAPRRPLAPEVPECTTCGACCFSDLPEYVRVWGGDHERLGDLAAEYTHFVGNRCFMKLTDGHCAALVIDPERGRFLCAVYPARPDACRGLEPGEPACRAERHEKHARPLIAVEALLRRRAVPPG